MNSVVLTVKESLTPYLGGSRSEWEYAVRAGTTSAYFWGAAAERGCGYMNGGDRRLARALPRWTETIRRDRAAGWIGARIFECDTMSA